MDSPLADEFKFYLDHQDELVEKYNGKYIVIKNDKVLSAYDGELEAVETTRQTEELGTFLVQHVTPGEESHEQTFHSRVSFA